MKKDKMSADNIDKMIHEPARLIIMLSLYVVEKTDFVFMMKLTGMSDGNLSSHMKKLRDAGYVEIIKEFVNDKPSTFLKLSDVGRDAFRKYKRVMVMLLDNLPDK